MQEHIRQLLRATPFTPFVIRTADGREYPVPTAAHAWASPSGRILVEEDGRGVNMLSPLLIANVRTKEQQAQTESN